VKRIIFFSSSHKIGLTGQLTDFVCSCLDAGVRQDDFLCISGEREQFPGLFGRLDVHGVRYVKINGLDDHRNFFRLVREFDAEVERFVPGVVHAQTNWQLAIAAIVKYLYGRRYAILYTVHGYRHNYKFRSFMARYLMGIGLLFFADKVITPSLFLKKKFGFVKDKAEVIYLGVENDLWSEYRPPEFAGTKRLIFPGEFRQGKNQDTLIRTVKTYMDRTDDDDVELYLPGQGEKLEHCKSLCRKLGIEAKIHFPGFVDRAEMLRLYMLCQYAVIPSNVETFGLCIAEPFMLGRVVISRHVGVADDLITEGETGFFFENEKDLLQVLEHLFRDTEKCMHVSKNAYETRGVLSWEQICDHYLQTIDSL
jgi:glycosyltransferase involved in cell wall biosynthesis